MNFLPKTTLDPIIAKINATSAQFNNNLQFFKYYIKMYLNENFY